MNGKDMNQEVDNEWYNDAEKDLSQVTVEEFEQLCAALFDQRQVVEEKKEALSVEQAKKTALEAKVQAYLVAMDRKNYKSKLGTVSIVREESWALPKTDADRAAFFTFLKDEGTFDSLISVHSKTFNSYVKEKYKLAQEEGRSVEFKIPGVGEPSVYESVRVTKGK